MNNSQREIEKKFIIKHPNNLDVLYHELTKLPFVKIERTLPSCFTNDYYWKAPENSSVQIIRLRDSWGMGDDGFSRNLKERTIKTKDKKSNVNRLEINEPIQDCKQTYDMNCQLFGPPKGHIFKDERVIFTRDKMVLSLAKVNNESFIYFEVEGPTLELVEKYCQRFSEIFEMELETRNLYEIYIERK